MLNKTFTIMVGTMLGLGTLAFSSASASAAAMLPLSSVASGEANAANDGVIQVKHKHKWHNNYYSGYHCYDWYVGCSYRYHRPYVAFPLVFGFGAYDYYDYDYGYAGVGSAHVRWCLRHYRSYNPRTNLWVSYSGILHQCNSPYD